MYLEHRYNKGRSGPDVIDFVYMRMTTGHYSPAVQQAVRDFEKSRKIMLFDRDTMRVWAPFLAAAPTLWEPEQWTVPEDW